MIPGGGGGVETRAGIEFGMCVCVCPGEGFWSRTGRAGMTFCNTRPSREGGRPVSGGGWICF